MDIILQSDEINQIIEKCSLWISGFSCSQSEIALVGIRSRGVFLAERLANKLSQNSDHEILLGTIDITLYRDDLDDPRGNQQPQVRSSEIDFDMTGKTVILIDDVLYTGRTVRAAMDALMEFGRPRSIKLAVLVDRGGRELPIHADFVGHTVNVSKDLHVNVSFKESDDIDQVSIDKGD